MKIGSFLPLQSNPQQNKQAGQVSAPQRSSDATSEVSAKSVQQSTNSSPQITPYAELVEAAEQLASSQAATQNTAASEGVLFNHNRDLSFNSQSALSAYMTNESFQTLSQGELVGVDLYA